MRQSRRFGLGKSKQYAWKKYNVAQAYVWKTYSLVTKYYWKRYSVEITSSPAYVYFTGSSYGCNKPSGTFYRVTAYVSGNVVQGSEVNIDDVSSFGGGSSTSSTTINATRSISEGATLPLSLTAYAHKAKDGYEYSYMWGTLAVQEASTHRKKGAYLDMVYSSSPTEYPQSGEPDTPDGYWYVYDHSEQISSGYSDGTVSSDSRYAYEDNGISTSINKWTIYQGYIESAGTQVGSVQSYNANDYPSNGKSSDGYWYILQTT